MQTTNTNFFKGSEQIRGNKGTYSAFLTSKRCFSLCFLLFRGWLRCILTLKRENYWCLASKKDCLACVLALRGNCKDCFAPPKRTLWRVFWHLRGHSIGVLPSKRTLLFAFFPPKRASKHVAHVFASQEDTLLVFCCHRGNHCPRFAS